VSRSIPKTIHQSWKTAEVPERWRPLQRSWPERHPSWEYRFWTDRDNRALIAEHYPDLLELYDSYRLDICRAELARYMVLRKFGGLYVDLDFEALRPVDPLLDDSELVFATEPQNHAEREPVRERGLKRIVCNAFIASAPEHPFWTSIVEQLQRSRDLPNPLDTTSVFLFTRVYEAFSGRDAVRLLPSETIYPIDSEQARDETNIANARHGSAYAIHHWHGSWWREATLNSVRERIARARRPSR
jgi:hypothetical protein